MAERDEYIGEAYDELKKLSLDEQKKIEYELREKAVRDYNTQMKSAERRGEARGEKRGIEKGQHLAILKLVGKKIERGFSPEEIAELFEIDPEEVLRLAKEWENDENLRGRSEQ